jgi:hypothetical protein
MGVFVRRHQGRSEGRGAVTAQCASARINPLKPNDLEKHRVVSPLNINIPSKNMCEKPTNTPIIYSVYLYMVASTCFSITLQSSESVPSAF